MVKRMVGRVGFSSWPPGPAPQGISRCDATRLPPDLLPNDGGIEWNQFPGDASPSLCRGCGDDQLTMSPYRNAHGWKGLVTSQRCSVDRRTVRLSLATAGAALADLVPAILHDGEERFLSGLDHRVREMLRRLLCPAAGPGEPAVCDGGNSASSHHDKV